MIISEASCRVLELSNCGSAHVNNIDTQRIDNESKSCYYYHHQSLITCSRHQPFEFIPLPRNDVFTPQHSSTLFLPVKWSEYQPGGLFGRLLMRFFEVFYCCLQPFQSKLLITNQYKQSFCLPACLSVALSFFLFLSFSYSFSIYFINIPTVFHAVECVLLEMEDPPETCGRPFPPSSPPIFKNILKTVIECI